jgi:hypothetical protein
MSAGIMAKDDGRRPERTLGGSHDGLAGPALNGSGEADLCQGAGQRTTTG